MAEQAYRFAEQIEPAFVFAHSVRSYLYARELVGRERRAALAEFFAWFEGASESGPRALGHRSINADPRDPQMKDTLNAAAANTADTTLIPQVADGVEAVLAEGLKHHLFLGRVLGKVKS